MCVYDCLLDGQLLMCTKPLMAAGEFYKKFALVQIAACELFHLFRELSRSLTYVFTRQRCSEMVQCCLNAYVLAVETATVLCCLRCFLCLWRLLPLIWGTHVFVVPAYMQLTVHYIDCKTVNSRPDYWHSRKNAPLSDVCPCVHV